MVIIMKERIRHFIYLCILIGIDQASKYWAKATLQKDGAITLIPNVLKLQYHENSGAVWGILQGKAGALSIFTIFILAALLFVYLHIPRDRKYTALKLVFIFIAAGAVGNLIDRMRFDYVVDFIYFELINFPVFNIADSYVTVASILIIILAIFYYKDTDLDFLDQMFCRKNTKQEKHKNP
jgi:signal peptidase II